ncbi:hypothetical protein KAI92_01565 [Candidatus Parcubacteria bacterium]|nr:hypothetical protein [Candidatus Parcubacteria bacterium]
MKFKLGKNQQKILLLLSAGIGFGLSYNPRTQKYIIQEFKKSWRKINKRSLNRSVNSLKEHKLVSFDEGKNSFKAVLTKDGMRIANKLNFRNIKIKKPVNWDKKWRVVMFDVSEKNRFARDSLRGMLKRLKFVELQKSVFVYPYECEKEINMLIQFFGINSSVKFLEANYINNQNDLKKIFKLS